MKANPPFWVAMLDFERHGYAFRYHWIERCTIALNAFCDDRDDRGRKAIQALGPPLTPEGRALSIYDVNPDSRASP